MSTGQKPRPSGRGEVTKADRIRELAAYGYTDGRIRDRVSQEFGFCSASYVRTCARQRVNGQSESDVRYKEKFAKDNGCSRSTLRYHRDSEYRQRQLISATARFRERWATDPEFRQRKCERQRAWRARKKEAA